MERARYLQEIADFDSDCLIFIDEMSATNRIRRRRRGRAGKGKVAYMPEFFGKSNPNVNSLIAACNKKGMVLDACVLTDHNNNRADFEHYCREILEPCIGRYPGNLPSILLCVYSCLLLNCRRKFGGNYGQLFASFY